MQDIIVAIDGFSSCGKSTLAKALAKKMNYSYVDTGAMYRAVTLYLLRNELNWNSMSKEELEKTLDQIKIEFKFNSEKQQSETYLNGENIEAEIREKAVSKCTGVWHNFPMHFAHLRRWWLPLQTRRASTKH